MGGAAADFHRENSINNGLIQACLKSTTTREAWRRDLLKFLSTNCRRKSRLAGFSVHVDREVLRTQAPEVYDFLSHQVIDISSLDIIQWGLPPLQRAARSYRGSHGNHRAMGDNKAAIAKLKWYLSWLRDRLSQSDYNNY